MQEKFETIEDFCQRIEEDKQESSHLLEIANYMKRFVELAAFQAGNEQEKAHAIERIKAVRFKDYKIIRIFSIDNHLIAYLEPESENNELSFQKKEDRIPEFPSICEIPSEHRGRNYNLEINREIEKE